MANPTVRHGLVVVREYTLKENLHFCSLCPKLRREISMAFICVFLSLTPDPSTLKINILMDLYTTLGIGGAL
jgi:hypothetical protein